MFNSAPSFELKAFNSQKELLITLIETSVSDYVEFDFHEDLKFLPSFRSKFHGFTLASLAVWPIGSQQHSYFLNIQNLLRLQFVDPFNANVPFSEFIELFLSEAKK